MQRTHTRSFIWRKCVLFHSVLNWCNQGHVSSDSVERKYYITYFGRFPLNWLWQIWYAFHVLCTFGIKTSLARCCKMRNNQNYPSKDYYTEWVQYTSLVEYVVMNSRNTAISLHFRPDRIPFSCCYCCCCRSLFRTIQLNIFLLKRRHISSNRFEKAGLLSLLQQFFFLSFIDKRSSAARACATDRFIQ